jgi:hypothetical protein
LGGGLVRGPPFFMSAGRIEGGMTPV